MILDDKLKKEYNTLFATCRTKDSKLPYIKNIIDTILKNKDKYLAIETKLQIPWYLVATIHSLEASLNFKSQLHNGDPLTAKTTHVPKNRPLTGQAPYNWVDSAIDAFTLRKAQDYKNWSLEGILFFLEGYNGFGQRLYHPKVLSPYLWSWSEHYTKGKYGADGKWDDNLVSQQCGGAVLLRCMDDMKIIKLCSENVILNPPVTELKSIEIYTPEVFDQEFGQSIFKPNQK